MFALTNSVSNEECIFRALFCGVEIGVKWRTGANEVSITINLINAVDRWPVLILALIRRRIDRLFTIVGSIPISHDVIRGMRRVDERIVLAVIFANLNATCFFANLDHRIAETVELLFRSLSVGSIISVPATGHDMVGAWNPKSISRLAMSSTLIPALSLSARTSMMHSCATRPSVPL